MTERENTHTLPYGWYYEPNKQKDGCKGALVEQQEEGKSRALVSVSLPLELRFVYATRLNHVICEHDSLIAFNNGLGTVEVKMIESRSLKGPLDALPYVRSAV